MAMDFSPRDLGRARQSLMLGLAQNPLPGTDDALSALALIAARSRFTRPKPPSRTLAERRKPPGPDPSRFLPDAARAALLRLLTAKDVKGTDTIALAVLRAIRQSGLGLHPFDYSRLESFIAQFADELGPDERQWLKAVRPNQKQAAGGYDDDPVSEETLALAGKAQKLAFLKDLRRRDPGKALSLIGQLLPAESANVRAELVGLIGMGLGEADKAFLESLAADRAQSVRDGAAMLLARMPGTGAYQKKLEQARDKIEMKKTGLLRRRAVLSLRLEPRPNVTHADPLFHAVEMNGELFNGLKLADLASSLKMPISDLIAASTESDGFGHLVLKLAVLESFAVDLKAFSPLFAEDDGRSALFILKVVLPETSGSTWAGLLELALSPKNWRELPAPITFEQFYDALGEPLPAHLAELLLQSPLWRDALQDSPEDAKEALAQRVAPLIPRALSERFIADAESLSRRAALYHRFLLTLPEPPDMRT